MNPSKLLKKFLIVISVQFMFISCNKEAAQDLQCNCYERHEVIEFESVNGLVGFYWAVQYETLPIYQDCELETGEYIYKSQSERYRIICD